MVYFGCTARLMSMLSPHKYYATLIAGPYEEYLAATSAVR